MNYSIAFFSEIQFTPKTKISRTHKNLRTDLSWMVSLDAVCHTINFDSIVTDPAKYDIAMVIIPKYRPDMQQLLLENIDNMKKRFKKVICIQEGPADLIHDFETAQQFAYLKLLKKFDAMFCHNQKDKKYFQFLLNKECYVIPTLMIDNLIQDLHKPKILDKNKKIKIMISGNIGNWYHALDSYVAVEELKKEYDIDAYCVTMGRKSKDEQNFTNYRYVPYVDWSSWMRLLSNMDFGINATRRTGAETFNLNCKYLGIPTFSRFNLYPDINVDYRDEFKYIINNYEQLSEREIIDYDDNYSEEWFLVSMEKDLTKILNT